MYLRSTDLRTLVPSPCSVAQTCESQNLLETELWGAGCCGRDGARGGALAGPDASVGAVEPGVWTVVLAPRF